MCRQEHLSARTRLYNILIPNTSIRKSLFSNNLLVPYTVLNMTTLYDKGNIRQKKKKDSRKTSEQKVFVLKTRAYKEFKISFAMFVFCSLQFLIKVQQCRHGHCSLQFHFLGDMNLYSWDWQKLANTKCKLVQKKLGSVRAGNGKVSVKYSILSVSILVWLADKESVLQIMYPHPVFFVPPTIYPCMYCRSPTFMSVVFVPNCSPHTCPRNWHLF